VNELRRDLDELPLISERQKAREGLIYPKRKSKGIGER